MPKSKFYCDYCDSYLASSMKARKQHNDGWKHRGQVKNHYAEIAKGYTQMAIGQMTRPFAPFPMGGPMPPGPPQMMPRPGMAPPMMGPPGMRPMMMPPGMPPRPAMMMPYPPPPPQ